MEKFKSARQRADPPFPVRRHAKKIRAMSFRSLPTPPHPTTPPWAELPWDEEEEEEEEGERKRSSLVAPRKSLECLHLERRSLRRNFLRAWLRRFRAPDRAFRRWVALCRPSDGRGQEIAPWPQYAFKMSMFNVSCNSH